jgi:hypothetical protein
MLQAQALKCKQALKKTYVLGLIAHSIRDALFEALKILVEEPLVFEQHCVGMVEN